ncbi:hypothetical protein CCACVL1_21532 [Corchorus capsularis]|uniref:Uncharacterized protein n=1 Tax=Corchorus capsularis TaxID=210143 RepID=A0A1R3H518_COCAP|nr:hypothetical protein CCACVL1_21532 [Corchorus capsularis]
MAVSLSHAPNPATKSSVSLSPLSPPSIKIPTFSPLTAKPLSSTFTRQATRAISTVTPHATSISSETTTQQQPSMASE